MSDKEKVNGEEVEVVAVMCKESGKLYHYSFNLSKPEPLMTVAQHRRITEALRGESSQFVRPLIEQVNTLEKERDQLRAEVERLQDDLVEQLKSTDRWHEIACTHSNEVDQLRAEVERLTKLSTQEDEHWRSLVNDIQAERDDLNLKVYEQRDEIKQLRAQLAQQQSTSIEL